MNPNMKLLLALLGLTSFAAILYWLGSSSDDLKGFFTISPINYVIFRDENNSNVLDFGRSWRMPKVEHLPNCSEMPPGLRGQLNVDLRMPPMEEVEKEHSNLELGGHWRPKECVARSRVAIVLPYRNREAHLRGFLHHLHGVFQSQQLDYTIVVVEQADNLTFNRGKLINVGFIEAQKLYDWQCFVFHDVDSLPENDMNIYSCPSQANVAKYMTVAFEKNGYKPYYEELLPSGASEDPR